MSKENNIIDQIFGIIAPTGNWAFDFLNSAMGAPDATLWSRFNEFRNASALGQSLNDAISGINKNKVTGEVVDEASDDPLVSSLDLIKALQGESDNKLQASSQLARDLLRMRQQNEREMFNLGAQYGTSEKALDRGLALNLAGLEDDTTRYTVDKTDATQRYGIDQDYKLGMAGLKNAVDLANVQGQFGLQDRRLANEASMYNSDNLLEGTKYVSDNDITRAQLDADARVKAQELAGIYGLFGDAWGAANL